MADIAFFVAHLPMSAVLHSIKLSAAGAEMASVEPINMISRSPSNESNYSSTSKPAASSTSSSSSINLFLEPLWRSWRASPLLWSCIPRLQFSVEFWARLLEMNEGGAKTVPIYDLDIMFMGYYAWSIFLIGVLLLAGSVRETDTGFNSGCDHCSRVNKRMVDGNAAPTAKIEFLCSCAENSNFLASWRNHVAIIKKTLLIMGRRWLCGNTYFEMRAWMERRREEIK